MSDRRSDANTAIISNDGHIVNSMLTLALKQSENRSAFGEFAGTFLTPFSATIRTRSNDDLTSFPLLQFSLPTPQNDQTGCRYVTSSSAIAEGPRDALSQLTSCQLLHNCTKNHI